MPVVLQILIGILLIASAIGVIVARRPMRAALCFLATLLLLAFFYLQLAAEFVAVMQILVYAGAILVLVIFVMLLFQDAHEKIHQYVGKSSRFLITFAASAFGLAILFLMVRLCGAGGEPGGVPAGFGEAEALGKALYLDYFFPFEMVILLLLVGVVGAVYVGKKED